MAGRTFRVIGIVSGGSTTDVYIPLAQAQALSGMAGQVNTIYVAADSAANIPAVAKEIGAAQPKATVTTSSDLASEVTGSLSIQGPPGTASPPCSSSSAHSTGPPPASWRSRAGT